MTCEKFEDALMDELYGELDEVTSAALRRHASSCVRCAERISSMRATRKVLASAFAPVDPPADLEERIFAAAAEARKVVPIKSRMTRYVSVAGRWAMRPQTAMAAVFLVMIGSSVVFMRERPASMSNVVVTERGAPAESAAGELAADTRERDKDKGGDLSAAAAHGPEPVAQAAATIAPTTASPAELQKGRAESAPASSAFAMNEKKQASARLSDDGFAPRPRAPSRSAAAGGGVGGESPFGESETAVATRPAAKAAAAPVAAATPAAPPPATMAPGGAAPADSQGSPFASAMAAYRGKRYSDATRMFDSLAQQGDANAALWAARSERESSGCAAAVGRFDRIGGSSWGAAAGYDATLEAGKCYRSLGSFEAARARFARLLTVPSHATRAQAELDAMSPRAAKPPAAAAPSKAGTVAE